MQREEYYKQEVKKKVFIYTQITRQRYILGLMFDKRAPLAKKKKTPFLPKNKKKKNTWKTFAVER